MAIVNHFQSCPALNTSFALTLLQHHYDWIGASEVSKSAKASRRARVGERARRLKMAAKLRTLFGKTLEEASASVSTLLLAALRWAATRIRYRKAGEV